MQQRLDINTLVNDDEDIASIAGLVIAVNGQIPKPGDVLEVAPLQIQIIEANNYRVDLVRVVKQTAPHEDEEY